MFSLLPRTRPRAASSRPGNTLATRGDGRKGEAVAWILHISLNLERGTPSRCSVFCLSKSPGTSGTNGRAAGFSTRFPPGFDREGAFRIFHALYDRRAMEGVDRLRRNLPQCAAFCLKKRCGKNLTIP